MLIIFFSGLISGRSEVRSQPFHSDKEVTGLLPLYPLSRLGEEKNKEEEEEEMENKEEIEKEKEEETKMEKEKAKEGEKRNS